MWGCSLFIHVINFVHEHKLSAYIYFRIISNNRTNKMKRCTSKWRLNQQNSNWIIIFPSLLIAHFSNWEIYPTENEHFTNSSVKASLDIFIMKRDIFIYRSFPADKKSWVPNLFFQHQKVICQNRISEIMKQISYIFFVRCGILMRVSYVCAYSCESWIVFISCDAFSYYRSIAFAVFVIHRGCV